jgi:intracellular septation protein
MKFLFDLFPVILFFGVFKWGEGHADAAQGFVSHYLTGFVSGGAIGVNQAPILLATAVAIIATTIYFHDETFIKWKPTVLYWCFAGALLISQFFMKKNLIRAMMEKQMALPEPLWARVGVAWIVFFLTMGLLNLYVAFNYTTDQWVNFKLFGGMGLMFVFIIGQSLLLAKYIKESE